MSHQMENIKIEITKKERNENSWVEKYNNQGENFTGEAQQ